MDRKDMKFEFAFEKTMNNTYKFRERHALLPVIGTLIAGKHSTISYER